MPSHGNVLLSLMFHISSLIFLFLRIKQHLELLAIASNITQASFCRLDTGLLTFGFLMMQYRNMTDEEDLDAANAIMESLERRWAVADQQIFIASIILTLF
jgi:hypothetical protein